MDLQKSSHPFLVGIKGVGMTALAIIANQLGKRVTGSDVSEPYLTDPVLKKAGIAWQVGFQPGGLPAQTDYLVATAAHGGMTNPQVLEAKRRGIAAVSYAQAVGALASRFQQLAVTGVGGKTTTTAMIASILTEAGLDPSFIIGAAKTPPKNLPGYLGQGEFFVLEADDYVACPLTDRKPKFSYLQPAAVVMTNLEFDHPDVYPDLGAMIKAYRDLALQIPKNGLLVVNGDSKALNQVAAKGLACRVISFGFGNQADVVIKKFEASQGKTRFVIGNREEIILQVPGKLNALNATAALIVAKYVQVPPNTIRSALGRFRGLKRRFELIGKLGQAPVYDDYAHQPNEIQATLGAVRDWFPNRRIRVVFQPHTYSRTKALLAKFAQSLSLADEVILLKIFASQREKPDPNVSSTQLQAKIDSTPTRYFGDQPAAASYLKQTVADQDLILTMGAGDVYQLAEILVGRPNDHD